MNRAVAAREHLDGPLPPAIRRATLDDIAFLNAWFGGDALTLARIRRALARRPRDRPLVVVDVGGGRGDFAITVVRWARRRGFAVRVLVVDTDAATLATARPRTAAYPEIQLVRADATALPLRGVDVAVATLTLHHLDRQAATACLAEMAAAAAVGVVNDLLRTRFSLALVWVATRVLRLHPVSRHDGPLSVRRAYSPAELAALAERAGVRARIRRYPWLARLVVEIA